MAAERFLSPNCKLFPKFESPPTSGPIGELAAPDPAEEVDAEAVDCDNAEPVEKVEADPASVPSLAHEQSPSAPHNSTRTDVAAFDKRPHVIEIIFA